MVRRIARLLIIVALVALTAACAGTNKEMARSVTAPLDTTGYEPKVDGFLVVLDASQSMDRAYKKGSRFSKAKDLIRRMNATLPAGLDLDAGLRSFGNGFQASKSNVLVYGMTDFTQPGLAKAVDSLAYAGGNSPLSGALSAAGKDLTGRSDRLAMIVFSDGSHMDQAPVMAASKLAAAYGDRLCIYTVWVGDDQDGRAVLDAVARQTGCGFSASGATLDSQSGMTDFVRQVFFQEKVDGDSDGDGVTDSRDQCPGTPAGTSVDSRGCPLDSDKDGVIDDKDRCPNTPAGVQVDAKGCPLDRDGDGIADYLDSCPDSAPGVTVDDNGCEIRQAPASAEVTAAGTWIFKDVRFATGRADITPSSYPTLNEVAGILRDNPSLAVEIQGHTDNRGPVAYNKNLSQKRAESIQAYLEQQGISGSRLSAKGYGPDRPIAPNANAEGRAKNRRVEFKPIQ